MEERRHLVLVGGGHSHVEVLRRLGMRRERGLLVSLLCPDAHTPYSGMLPGWVAGHYDFDETHIDLEPLCRFAGARLLRDRAVGIDLEGRRLRCADRPDLRYDLLSLDVGSTPDLGVEGAREHATPVKPIGGFASQWERILDRCRSNGNPLRIGVVGAGAGGVEVLLAAVHRLRLERAEAGAPPESISGVIVGASDELLPSHGAPVRRRMRDRCRELGVELRLGTRVAAVEAAGLRLADGARLELDEILWVTAAKPPAWIAETGLALDDAGFVAVGPSLESTSHPGVFAAGDVAAMIGSPREKAGVIAVRQGPVLAENLRRAAIGRPQRRFHPQRHWLALISTGDRHAVASWRGRALAGQWVWRWKDGIDRRFMRRYAELPEMSALAPPMSDSKESAMRCGGCASKLGAAVLSRTLARLEQVADESVELGIGDDAAALAMPTADLLLQTVDYFRDFVDDPYRLGQIAAVHALGDLWAMGAQARTALAIATLPEASATELEETLHELLTGALRVFEAEGVRLVGGHSSEGAELGIGFSLAGTAARGSLLRNSGARPGDRLLLTKGLGVGVLFAARMRGRARGRWITAAHDSMLASSRRAAEILVEHGATACTDVTGFGLAGHALEVADASNLSIDLDLAALPVLPGALELLATGVESSLAPENRRAESAIDCRDPGTRSSARFQLLFDPQTAGGLLAALPPERAPACLEALRREGFAQTSAIGVARERSIDDKALRVAGFDNATIPRATSVEGPRR